MSGGAFRARVLAGGVSERTGRMLEAVLRGENLDVRIERDAGRLLERARRELPDLLLLGAVAELDLLQMLHHLRESSDLRGVPVVLLVPPGDAALLEKALAAGVVEDFLPLPFTGEEVALRVQRNLRPPGPPIASAGAGDLGLLESVLLGFATALDSRDRFRTGHPERMSRMARRLGERLRLSLEECDALARGGILHDIGMLRVSEELIGKAGSLTARELAAIKLHPVHGEQLCRPVPAFEPVLPIIRHHHEQVDGGGYPDGLAGKEIPLLARIMAVIDSFDSLCSDRPYRRRNSASQAVLHLEQFGSRGWLDRELVAEAVRMVKEEGWPEVPPASDPEGPED